MVTVALLAAFGTIRQWGWAEWASLGTLLSALTGLAVALLTLQMVEEMKAARLQQSRPVVLISLLLVDDDITVRLGNFGNGPAANVRLTFHPRLVNSKGEDIGSNPPLGSVIPLITPATSGTHLDVHFDQVSAYFRTSAAYLLERPPLQFECSIQYDDAITGDHFVDRTITLDLSSLQPRPTTTSHKLSQA